MEERRNRQLVSVVLILLVLFGFGWAVTNSIKHHGKTKITVLAVPADSKISLNGNSIASGSIYLKPGHYVFEATRKDFGPVQNTLDIKSKDPPQTIYLLPIPNTAAAIEFLNKHPEIQQQRERLGGVNSETNQANLTNKYPVLLKLPTYNSHYRIDYSLDGQQKISFSITLYAILNNPNQYQSYLQQLQQYKTEALQFLSSNGIDPAKFTITYTPNT